MDMCSSLFAYIQTCKLPPNSGTALLKGAKCCLDWWLDKRGSNYCCKSITLAVKTAFCTIQLTCLVSLEHSELY